MFSFGEEFDELAKEVSNWGRWGPDDQIGTINLIDSEAVRRGAASVRAGRTFSLALPLSEGEGIQLGFMPGRVNPVRTMAQVNVALLGDPDGPCTSDDLVTMGLQCATHWDGLGHVSCNGVMYNGYPASSITCFGASQAGIHHVRSLTSRGVLLDVARALGVDELEPGYAITGDDLSAAEELARATVLPGDVVLIRTGLSRRLGDLAGVPGRRNVGEYWQPCGGPSIHSVRWFREHDVAAVATDNVTFEVYPFLPEGTMLAVHVLHLVHMGMTQGQNFMLENLAADCAEDGVYDFLFAGSPQPFTNAVGSPVNPVVVK